MIRGVGRHVGQREGHREAALHRARRSHGEDHVRRARIPFVTVGLADRRGLTIVVVDRAGAHRTGGDGRGLRRRVHDRPCPT